ncbi:MAG: metal-dependent hydrolase [Psychromonas sp.]
MANFNTHLNVATVATGLTSAVLLTAGHIDLNNALWLWFLGVIGGLLPDIDSDNSTSLDTLFNLFALSGVLFVTRYITTELSQVSFIELIVIPLIAYGILKYLVRPLFEKITVHRGSCHSLFFLLLMALLTTQVIWRLNPHSTEQSAMIAWLSGGFIFLGGLIHLLLDEMFSVDLVNARIKRSFGTALKIAEFKNKSLTALTLVAIIGLAYNAPSPSGTIKTLSNWSNFKL